MAKGKDGGTNNYTSIKNPELLQDGRETRSLQEIVADGKKPEVKRDDETYVDTLRRQVVKEIQLQREKPQDFNTPLKENDKDKEPEKDKE